jgi:hypothetical protein
MRKKLAGATCCMFVLLLVSLLQVVRVSLGQAQAPLATLDAGPTKARPYVFDAQKSCKGCHGDQSQKNELCRMIEYHTWENLDPHRIALDWGQKGAPKAGSEAATRAWDIGDRLGIDDVTKSSRCTGCHSVSLPKAAAQKSFQPTAEGVTCVACHGPYQQWVLEHQVTGDTPWQQLTKRSEKWEKFGMVDLWNPVTRARVCMSCHIGDPDPEVHKLITHEIYAAGHPPLPSIEVAAFSDEQPQHWLYLRCKVDAATKRLEFNSDRLEQTEQVAVSGLMALRRTMELYAASGNGTAGDWPEFAQFDCSACHHELKASGGRTTQRGAPGGIGRPSAPTWSRALVRIALDAADPDKSSARSKKLDELLASFDAAITERPFGDRDKTAAAAEAIVDWTKEPLLDLSAVVSTKTGEKRRVIDQSEAFRLLRRLLEDPRNDYGDYESARQIGWAARTISHELRELAAHRPAGNKALESFIKNEPRVQQVLASLNADLVLSLRDPADVRLSACPSPNDLMTSPPKPKQSVIIGNILQERLKKLAGYDWEPVRQRFRELERLTRPP